MGYAATPLLTRFEKKYIPEPNSGCWLWTDHVDHDGYGIIWVGGAKRTAKAHRVSYELAVGEIPDGALVCHRCDIPSCVNPAHLFLGTNSDNMADMVRKGRSVIVLNPMPGERNGRAKLTEEAVIEIRRAHREGIQAKAIAERYELSRSTVHRIVRREYWKHVLEPYDPVADGIGSHNAAMEEIGRRVASGEEAPPTTGYFASKAGGAR